MTDIINFFINNRDNWLPLILFSAIITAALSFNYFFVYSYIINRRLKNPDKHYRLKLIMPRFACIIFAALAVLGTAKFLPDLWWQLDYSYVMGATGDEIEEYAYTYGQLENNESFKLYTAKSENFEYSLFRNDSFNGIIDMRGGKNHEFVLFVKYIGDRKGLNSEDIIECIVMNYSADGSGGVRGGGDYSGLDEELCLYGASYRTDTIGIDIAVYKKDSYKKYIDSDYESYDEEKLEFMHENIEFNLKKNTFSKPDTRVYE